MGLNDPQWENSYDSPPDLDDVLRNVNKKSIIFLDKKRGGGGGFAWQSPKTEWR